MNNDFKRLDPSAVISSDWNISGLMSNNTFKVSELLRAIQKCTGKQAFWFDIGVGCEVLGLTQGWQKGRVRISIEFCPDEPELADTSESSDEASSQPESPLDDIRRTIVD
ncbi:KGK domain-containing protein [Leptolyngbya sp. FACHB-671]|uniref:KGK domain-containing protein n=1 Tax=Leptolyngbya sp. FACHB-671 TaxID=2692812 RepID=UPI00168683ED|nr:KGK domain-containing protein [Leptolyngbya sp. FACHB-671]MBD2069403.1 KGK domain-containing protein [Leptolyngbya sp. FACHB-671]